MPVGGNFELVKVDLIDLDTSNPRIAHVLENYEPPYSADMLHLALETGGGDNEAGEQGSFGKLKASIEANGGIVQPILLQRRGDGRYLCVEGNTRVFLYRHFAQNGIAGTWDTIPSIVHADITEVDVHAIRLQAHLVGPRRWGPYAKAKYLYKLRHEDKFPMETLIQLCGGNARSIQESLSAYEDMEAYYRPIVGDESFETDQFSGFVELQKSGVKEALVAGGFSVADFAQWIADEKIGKLQNVRSIPLVMRDEKAKKVFLESSMDAAIKVLDRPQLTKALSDADVSSLARALKQALDQISYKEFTRLRDNPGSASVQYLREALEGLQDVIKNVDGE